MCIGYTSAIFESSLEFMGSWSGSFREWKGGNAFPIVDKLRERMGTAIPLLKV